VKRSSTSLGLVIGIAASLAFGMSGAFIKPLLEAGWSPAAAVTVRALVGGLVLLPVALVTLRGRWATLWVGRWRIAAMGFIGVAATQLVYFASLQRIPVSTAILVEYMAPILLVLFVWATSRRVPRAVVLIGSVVSVAGLVLVVSPGAEGALDVLGLVFAALATVGCAIYYVVAARPAQGLPPVALASAGLLLGGVALGIVGVAGLVPMTMTFGTVIMIGQPVAWWIPMALVTVIATGFAYAASITAAGLLGSRLASFVGLIEVVAAAVYSWILLGEALTLVQILGGVLILVGIGFVRSEKQSAEPGGLATGSLAVPLEPGLEIAEEAGRPQR
jgi:drug/metabolite transporter (DMT)-like permease